MLRCMECDGDLGRMTVGVAMHPPCLERFLERAKRDPSAQPANARCPACGERPQDPVYCWHSPYHRACLEQHLAELETQGQQRKGSAARLTWGMKVGAVRESLQAPPGCAPVWWWGPRETAPEERFVLSRYGCAPAQAEEVIRRLLDFDIDAEGISVPLYRTPDGTYFVAPHRVPLIDWIAGHCGLSPREG